MQADRLMESSCKLTTEKTVMFQLRDMDIF